ncbi:hypothetical protein [Brevundimonas sp.]|uniref:hypothetical protein n=1 Tax=Brevundimonas sp. TaxID=1871086 RepID=UPI0035AF3156
MTVPTGVFIFVEASDAQASLLAERFLEEGQWYDIGKGWRARADGAHVTGMKSHVHVYLKKDERFVINTDGTPSHGSDLSTLPNKIRVALQNRSLIESMIEEALGERGCPVPPEVISEAAVRWDRARLIDRAQQILKR